MSFFDGVTSIGQGLELLNQFGPRVRAVQYLTVAGASIFVYDYFLTFPAELRLIWQSKQLSLAKLAYVINRYGTIVLLGLLLDHTTSRRPLTPAFCGNAASAIILCILLFDAIWHALLLFRIFLLWDRNPVIVRTVFTAAVVAYVVSLPFVSFFVVDLKRGVSYIGIPLWTCAVLPSPKWLTGVWGPQILLDLYALILVLWNAISKPRSAKDKLFEILNHDGLFLIFVTWALRMINFSLCLVSNPLLGLIGLSFIEAAVATINARLFLKLYATPYISQEEELYLETRDLYYTSTDDGYSYTATLHDGIHHLHSSPSKTKKSDATRNVSRGSSMNKFRFGSWGSETRPFSHDSSKHCAVTSAEACHILASAGWRVCLILVSNNDHNDGEGKDTINIIMSAVIHHADGVPASTTAEPNGEITGISLYCTDMTSDGVEHRTYWYTRAAHPVIDLVRANTVKPGAISTSDGSDSEGAARATFSSPVMSRRHARISFEYDGRVSVVDLGSLHGTFIRNKQLDADVPFILESGDTIVLGKEIHRDSKKWEPVSILVTFEHTPVEAIKETKELTPSPNVFLASTPPSGDSEDEDEDEEARSTPNRYGVHMYSSPSYHSSDMSDSEDMETSSMSQSSDNESQQDAFGSPDLENEISSSESRSPSSAAPSVTNKLCSILPFDLGRYVHPGTSSRLPLPSLRDLGFFTSATARANADGNRNEASACSALPAPALPIHEFPNETVERQEPPMACLPPPSNGDGNLGRSYRMEPGNSGSMDHDYFFRIASNSLSVVPPDNNSNMFFSGDNYSQFLPSFPQNQLGALHFVDDIHDFGMGDMRLPGGLGGSEVLADSSFANDNITISIPESNQDALHERSRASSPMEISSGRPSPDLEDGELSSPSTSENVRDEGVSEDGEHNNDAEADAEDIPRSTLFLPPQRAKPSDPLIRTPSPEIAEISREVYMSGSKPKSKTSGVADEIPSASSKEAEGQEKNDLHRNIMSAGYPVSSQQTFRQALLERLPRFQGPVDIAKLKQSLLKMKEAAEATVPLDSRIILSASVTESSNGRSTEESTQPDRSGAEEPKLDEPSNSQKPAHVRREYSFSSLPTKIQALVAAEMNNVTSRITDLKESIGGLRPLVERQVAATLAMAAARSASESSRASSTETIAPTSPSIVSEAEAQKNLQDIREEMLRFSAIMEQVLAKIEPLRVQSEQAIQADMMEAEDVQVKSRKRKFCDLDVVEPAGMVIDCVSEDDPEKQRPTKRARTPTGSVTRSVATAAGYTSLGAILTFVTFAYLL